MNPNEIAQGTAVRRSYAYYIVAGTRIPHPRHYPNLAALVGVELPKSLLQPSQPRWVRSLTAIWLAESFGAAGLRAVAAMPPLRSFIGPGCGYRQMRRPGGFRDDPVPLMCWECGKALTGRKIRFCSQECATTFSAATHHSAVIDAVQSEGSKLPTGIDVNGARGSG
jgi:hypothetical protein